MNIEALIDKFKVISSETDLSIVLCEVVENQLKEKERTTIDDMKASVTLDSISKVILNINHEYTSFRIPKKSGGKRVIQAPSKDLKNIQRVIANLLEEIYEPSANAFGFIKGRSILNNAKIHVGQKYILNIDLKDFFPSISIQRIISVLVGNYGFNKQSAKIIASLCTRFEKLPQGSPASPVLTNMIATELDRRLERFAYIRGLRYSRYVDDITFSGQSLVFTAKFEAKLNTIVRNEGFRLNLKKTRILGESDRQEVTGIVVNEKINVSRKFIRKVRAMIHSLEKQAVHEFTNDTPDRFLSSQTIATMGCVNFIGQVRGYDDALYLKMAEKLTSILSRNEG